MPEKRWDAIIKRCPKDRPIIGAEIGVYKGKNARNLLNLLPNLTLYLIDRWIEYTENEIKSDEASTMGFVKKESWDKIYNKVLKLQKRQGNDRVKIIRKSSRSASKRFIDNSLDFVFIDAGHSYKSVKQDIEVWLSKIRLGGFIGGHDYNRPGVKMAVEFIFNGRPLETDVDKTWFCRID